jgi:hypothetical protein
VSGKLISRYCQAYRVHCDDFRIFGTPAQRALAAATGTARTPQAVECEASQSGPQGNAQNKSED